MMLLTTVHRCSLLCCNLRGYAIDRPLWQHMLYCKGEGRPLLIPGITPGAFASTLERLGVLMTSMIEPVIPRRAFTKQQHQQHGTFIYPFSRHPKQFTMERRTSLTTTNVPLCARTFSTHLFEVRSEGMYEPVTLRVDQNLGVHNCGTIRHNCIYD